jgi:glycerol-3-phosphate acyltransferase PlsY
MLGGLFCLVVAYVLGSLPTAVLVSRYVAGRDIREMGDGNMGARNVTHTLGYKAGALVAAADFSKGAISVFLAQSLAPSAAWQLGAGVSAVIGHDFPLFAGFRGGQGMATSLGVLVVLMPVQTLFGLMAFGGAYLITRHFDGSAGIGLGLIASLAFVAGLPVAWVAYAAVLFVSIGLKKWLDLPRRAALARAEQAQKEPFGSGTRSPR